MARTAQVPRLRQRDVDELVEVPHGRTAHYENGRAAPPHAYLVRLSQLWSIPVAWFLDSEPSDVPTANGSEHRDVAHSGFAHIELRPSLPLGDWGAGQQLGQIEVETKFVRRDAFGTRASGEGLAPHVLHGDILVWWPSAKPRVGVVTFTHNRGQDPRIVVPTFDEETQRLIAMPVGNDKPYDEEPRYEAYLVGIIRTLPEGEVLTRANFSGIRCACSQSRTD